MRHDRDARRMWCELFYRRCARVWPLLCDTSFRDSLAPSGRDSQMKVTVKAWWGRRRIAYAPPDKTSQRRLEPLCVVWRHKEKHGNSWMPVQTSVWPGYQPIDGFAVSSTRKSCWSLLHSGCLPRSTRRRDNWETRYRTSQVPFLKKDQRHAGGKMAPCALFCSRWLWATFEAMANKKVASDRWKWPRALSQGIKVAARQTITKAAFVI